MGHPRFKTLKPSAVSIGSSSLQTFALIRITGVFERSGSSWTPPKTSWRAPRDHDSVDLIANGGVGCGVRPGSSISGASEGAFGQGRHARAAEWFGGF